MRNKNIFGAAAAVCGMGSIVGRGSTYYCTLPVWSPVTLSAISFLLCQPRFPFDRYHSPSLFPWMPPITDVEEYKERFNVNTHKLHEA